MGDPATDGLQPTPIFGFQYRIDPALAPMLAQPVQPGVYNRYRVFDGKLTLDADLMSSFAETMARLRSPSAMEDFRRPNWQLFAPELAKFLTMAPPNLLATPPAGPASPVDPPKGPDESHAAKLSDLMDAMWKLPQIQTLANRARGPATWSTWPGATPMPCRRWPPWCAAKAGARSRSNWRPR